MPDSTSHSTCRAPQGCQESAAANATWLVQGTVDNPDTSAGPSASRALGQCLVLLVRTMLGSNLPTVTQHTVCSCMMPNLNHSVMQGAQLEALKVLTLLLAQLGKAMAEYAPELMQRAWQLLSGEQERASCAV
jgi:hypothetical protein